jgi:uncharacterized membrane protein YcjF (UPF0283 family)
MAAYETDEISPEEAAETAADAALLRRQRWMILWIVLGGLVFVAMIVLAVIGLLQSGEQTAKIRDIFIIFMAFESLVIGAALIVLVIQVASLVNLLQNEVKPILGATNETVNTLRGTTAFLSENLVEPVIKLNSYLAGLRRLFQLFGIKEK